MVISDRLRVAVRRSPETTERRDSASTCETDEEEEEEEEEEEQGEQEEQQEEEEDGADDDDDDDERGTIVHSDAPRYLCFGMDGVTTNSGRLGERRAETRVRLLSQSLSLSLSFSRLSCFLFQTYHVLRNRVSLLPLLLLLPSFFLCAGLGSLGCWRVLSRRQ